MVKVESISKEEAKKEFGATIRTETVTTNPVDIWMEFKPRGKLQTFSSVDGHEEPISIQPEDTVEPLPVGAHIRRA